MIAVSPERATLRPRTRRKVYGSAVPRLAPPRPRKHDAEGLRATAADMGLTFMPWQDRVAEYLTAEDRAGNHLYSEILVMVARQNGKTTIAKPLIARALKAGLRVLHLANKRELPREMHNAIADFLTVNSPELFTRRRGKTIWPRYGAGQEEIRLENGGTYRIAAANTGAARGWAADVLVIDELRELKDFGTMASAESTLATSPNPLTVYFSNEGDEESVILASVKARAGADPNLAVLSYSAAPELDAGDRAGWLQANPAIGHFPSLMTWLEKTYERHRLAGTLAIFEAENLCRAVPTLTPRVVNPGDWAACAGQLPSPVSPGLGVKLDIGRAAAALAWRMTDGRVALRVVLDRRTAPVDTDAVGKELRQLRARAKSLHVAYDAWTDEELAKYLRGSKAVNGREFANACENFARLVDGRRLVWADADAIGEDLVWAGRKVTDSGWQAVSTDDAHPATALMAAIRAVWLASGPRPPAPRCR